MIRTWTDTHYKLTAADDYLFVSSQESQNSASLICPGYERDGEGFSIHFTPAQIPLIEELLATLRIIDQNQTKAN